MFVLDNNETENMLFPIDDDGHIFVYDPKPNSAHTNGEQSGKSSIILFFQIDKFLLFFSDIAEKI